MNREQNLITEFSVEELEARLEMKGWITYCPGSTCGEQTPVEEVE
ncbi:hypothetical protein SAMN06265349_10622 [Flavobacterium resistens]|uniref:Uncharacterized protein n=1 Tax=Flavobacterium resistens TaxID=443612 RepID=A0A521EZF3_9FLAO|nr:hypothetical protein [Flavobacterium resistens]SMO89289.1 hypothetical protein SAMN06265349_10622 [Flavobacterium resistens]